MDIGKLLEASEWTEPLRVEGSPDFIFKLKIRLLGPLEQYDLWNGRQDIIEIPNQEKKIGEIRKLVAQILDLVQGWDFDSAGQPISCTTEMKKKYLEGILFRRIMQDDGTLGESLLRNIVGFSVSPESVAKN